MYSICQVAASTTQMHGTAAAEVWDTELDPWDTKLDLLDTELDMWDTAQDLRDKPRNLCKPPPTNEPLKPLKSAYMCALMHSICQRPAPKLLKIACCPPLSAMTSFFNSARYATNITQLPTITAGENAAPRK